MKNFTFKKQKRETGLAGVAHPRPSVDIKLEGKVVGTLAAPYWNSGDNLWRIRFTVKEVATKEHPADWKWVTLKARPTTEEEARETVIKSAELIQTQFNLHKMED